MRRYKKRTFFRKIVARFKFFTDICTPKRDKFPNAGRNSSAVEHFTRNEGVPSSNLGFGSKANDNQSVIVCFLFMRRSISGPRSLPFQREVWRDCLYKKELHAVPEFKSRFRLTEAIANRLSLLFFVYTAENSESSPAATAERRGCLQTMPRRAGSHKRCAAMLVNLGFGSQKR